MLYLVILSVSASLIILLTIALPKNKRKIKGKTMLNITANLGKVGLWETKMSNNAESLIYGKS